MLLIHFSLDFQTNRLLVIELSKYIDDVKNLNNNFFMSDMTKLYNRTYIYKAFLLVIQTLLTYY